MANYRLTLCYDGTRWKGWQKQGNTEQTIQGKLEALLTRLLDQPVEVAGSGRTAAGAHAKMQVASFRAKTDNVFERHYLYHIQEPLDVAAMRLAAEDLCGTHDFRAFCSLKKFKRSTVRRLEAITIQELGPELRLTFTGDGFLYHMVRILVGTLLAVGRGEKSPRDMADILASQDRRQAGETVPACGLCLEAVHYTR